MIYWGSNFLEKQLSGKWFFGKSWFGKLVRRNEWESRMLPPIHFIRPKKICSSLFNTTNSFIWLEGHFRPIYLTKIEPVLIYSSQFWYKCRSHGGKNWLVVFSLKICTWSIPLRITVPLIPPKNQFGVPSFPEINFSSNNNHYTDRQFISLGLSMTDLQYEMIVFTFIRAQKLQSTH